MLQKLRSKSDHFKKSLSLFLTVIIFSGILFIWVSSWDARARDSEIREMTVSPIDGVTAMFEGLVSDVQEQLSGTPTFVENTGTSTLETSTKDFDMSGVIVIDSATTTTE